MSESEKKKRGAYRKNRERWIFAQTVIIVVVAIAVLISAIVSYQLSNKYYIEYNESGSIDYDVYLKENEFYDSPHQEKNQSYVASLIDKIIASFNYEIDMDAEDVNYRYSYTITSRLEIMDDTSDVPIYNSEYELVNVQNKSQSTSNRLKINEIVILNYDEYNDLAGRFLETYDLSATTSNIVVTLNVDVLSDCNAFSGSSVDTYSSELRIPLTTKTVNIKMTSSVPDAEAKMIACTRGAGSEVFKTTAIVLGIVDALLILILVAFSHLTRTDDITYTARVKKIVSQYKSYIQKIKNLFDMHGYQVIMVDTFDEMLEIKDTIQAPILMYENEDKTCAKFMIPTDSKLLYLFEIKIEGYVEPETEPREEPTPTTIVKPNITNVVRPVVKVVLNPSDPTKAPDPEPEIETVLEEAEVEVESNTDEVPEVTATVEEGEDAPACETTEDAEAETEEAPEVVEEPNLESCEAEVDAEADETVEAVEESETAEEVVEEIILECCEVEVEANTDEAPEVVVTVEKSEDAEKVVEETVLESCEIEAEAGTKEAPEATEESDLVDTEVEEMLASIPCVDEESEGENMVEAIDVFWDKKTRKTHCYNPDGSTVREGDVVLVPTRDEESDKNIIREAEVVRGNYKIDSATLDRPLNKIIGIVRRRAEHIFTAMITPTEEKENQ